MRLPRVVAGLALFLCASALRAPGRAPRRASPELRCRDGGGAGRPQAPASAVARAIAGAALALGMAMPLPAAASLTPEQALIAETWRTVDKLYYDRTFNGIDWFSMRQELMKAKYSGGLAGAQDALAVSLKKLGDPYTRFLTPSAYDSIYASATGEIAGIGVQLSRNDAGEVVVADAEVGAPAASAGIAAGTIIDAVDGTPLASSKAASLDEVAAMLRGQAGSGVAVVVRDGGSAQAREVKLTRVALKLTSVREGVPQTFSSGGRTFGNIRIKSFSGETAEQVARLVNSKELRKCDAFVLDMRTNGGGLITGAIDTAKLFLPYETKIVTVRSKTGPLTYTTNYKPAEAPSGDATTADNPDRARGLILLVDDQTASAAEVLSAALQDNGRASIVGAGSKVTFGKGIIQSVQRLRDGSGVAITVASYETPAGANINKRGIAVDEQVACGVSDSAPACLAKADVAKLLGPKAK